MLDAVRTEDTEVRHVASNRELVSSRDLEAVLVEQLLDVNRVMPR